ncbi:hypothetical protein D3C85_1516670 [compost metagenome]
MYGMWIRLTPVIDLKTSAAMCCGLPDPAEAYDSASGLALACAMSSATDRAEIFGDTISTMGTRPSMVTPWTSLRTSKGSLGYSTGLTDTVWLGAIAIV